MLHLTFRQLSVFEAVARLLSFSRAAQELHLSQPAVSIQIKQLEDKIGIALFEQLGKKIYLTDAGREVYQYSRSIAQQLEEMEAVLGEMKGARRGKLAISVASTANYFVPTLLGVFHDRFPGVTVSLDVTNRETLVYQLQQNLVDLVVMGQPPTDIDLEYGPFRDNPLVIIAPPDHPLAGQRQIPLKRLEDEVFLTREKGSGTRSAIERFFESYDITIRTGMEIASNEAIKQSVQAGLGLGLLSSDTLEMELALGKLVILDVQHFPILRKWYVMHRKGKRLSAVAQAFKSFLTDEAGGLLDSQKSAGAGPKKSRLKGG